MPVGRLDSEHRGELEWRGGSFGFAELETNCLAKVRLARQTVCMLPEQRVQPTFEDIQTDTAKLVNIWVIDLGEEPDLWWGHGIVVWQE